MKTIITNGTLVAHDKSSLVDIAIEDNVITEIAENINKDNAYIIDAKGCYILPGSVDMHTQLASDENGNFSAQAFKQNSLAALYGGTTTVVEEVQTIANTSGESLKQYMELMKSNSYCDYSFHQSYNEVLDDKVIEQRITGGFPSYIFKSNEKNPINDKDCLDLLRLSTPYGATVFIEAESEAPISIFEDLHKIKKRTTPYALATSRPAWAESEAFIRISNLARAGGFTFAIDSVSTKEVVELLHKQVHEGLPITMLASLHHLVFTDDKYLSDKNYDEETYKYCVHPPLRKSADVDALWKAINSGLIHCIVSKHNGTHLAKKVSFQEDIFNVPVGIPSVELRLPLLYTFGVATGKISINKMVEITATHVTRIAGLRSKGRIEAGTDADIVIFDPNHTRTISKNALHDSSDYSPYEGMTLQGFAKHVLLRGKEVIKDFKHVEEENHGELIFRKAVSMR